MRIDGPTNPFHISRAYGVPPASRPSPPQRAETAHPTERINHAEQAQRAMRARAAKLVGAVVPGRIDFSAGEPRQASGPLPFYAHPADRNVAATAIHAGRTIDVSG